MFNFLRKKRDERLINELRQAQELLIRQAKTQKVIMLLLVTVLMMVVITSLIPYLSKKTNNDEK